MFANVKSEKIYARQGIMRIVRLGTCVFIAVIIPRAQVNDRAGSGAYKISGKNWASVSRKPGMSSNFLIAFGVNH